MQRHIALTFVLLIIFTCVATAQISDADFDYIKKGIEANRQRKEGRNQAELLNRQEQTQREFERRQKEVESAEQSARESRQRREQSTQQTLRSTQQAQNDLSNKMKTLASSFAAMNRIREQERLNKNNRILERTIDAGQDAIDKAEQANQQNLLEMERFSEELNEFMRQQAPKEDAASSSETASEAENEEKPNVDNTKAPLANGDSQAPEQPKPYNSSPNPQKILPSKPALNVPPVNVPLASVVPKIESIAADQILTDPDCVKLFLAEVSKEYPIPTDCDPLVRWGGAVESVSGAFQTVGCGVATYTSAPTGIGPYLGALCTWNGIDHTVTGWRQFWTCEPQETATYSVIKNATGSDTAAGIVATAFDAVPSPSALKNITRGTNKGVVENIAGRRRQRMIETYSQKSDDEIKKAIGSARANIAKHESKISGYTGPSKAKLDQLEPLKQADPAKYDEVVRGYSIRVKQNWEKEIKNNQEEIELYESLLKSRGSIP